MKHIFYVIILFAQIDLSFSSKNTNNGSNGFVKNLKRLFGAPQAEDAAENYNNETESVITDETSQSFNNIKFHKDVISQKSIHESKKHNFDIKIERQIVNYFKKNFKNLNIDKKTQKILVKKLQETYENVVRQLTGLYHNSNNWFNDMANKVHNNLEVSLKELKYSQDLMDQCNQKTLNFQNEINEHLHHVHKLHIKNHVPDIANAQLPSFIKKMGYKKTLNKKKSVIIPSNHEQKFRKMANKLFFGLNKLYRKSKHNWENIIKRYNKQMEDTEQFVIHNKIIGNVIRGIKKKFE